MHAGAFDKILPIEKCWLMDDLHNQIRNEVRDYAVANGLSFFDLRAQVGLQLFWTNFSFYMRIRKKLGNFKCAGADTIYLVEQ